MDIDYLLTLQSFRNGISDAITTATGYSFPSGHTMTAVPIYGGLAAGAAGAVLLFFLIETVGAPMKELLGLQWGALAQNMIIFLYILCGWPMVMKKCARHGEETVPAAVQE